MQSKEGGVREGRRGWEGGREEGRVKGRENREGGRERERREGGKESDVCLFSISHRPIGDQGRAGELEGVSVFEVKKVFTGKKRKRKEKGDPGDLDGYMGPWREYEDQVRNGVCLRHCMTGRNSSKAVRMMHVSTSDPRCYTWCIVMLQQYPNAYCEIKYCI